jgi:hypothetical protein
LGISVYLACVGLAEADDTNAISRLGEAHHVDSIAKQTDRNDSRLGVALALIDPEERRLEREVCGLLTREAAEPDVSLVLGWIERDVHTANCTYEQISNRDG